MYNESKLYSQEEQLCSKLVGSPSAVSIHLSMNCEPVSKQINTSKRGFYGQNQSAAGCQDCLEEKVNTEVEWSTDFNVVFTL